jgi:hypothetical protein
VNGLDVLRKSAGQGPGERVPYIQAADAAEVLARVDAAEAVCDATRRFLADRCPSRLAVLEEVLNAWLELVEPKPTHGIEYVSGIIGDPPTLKCRCGLDVKGINEAKVIEAFAEHYAAEVSR